MALTDMIIKNAQPRSATTLTNMTDISELESIFRLFLLNCKSRNLSEKTQDDYRQKIGSFVQLCVNSGITSPEDITDTHIDLFLGLKSSKCKPISIADYFRCIKRFFRWMVKKKIITVNPVDFLDAPKFQEPERAIFTEEHLKIIFEQCECCDSHFESARNKAIILTFLDEGFRLSELAGITLDDICESAETITVLGKGSKKRTVRMTRAVTEAIYFYMIARKKAFPDLKDQHLWINRRGKPFKAAGIRQMIYVLSQRAGLSGVRCCPHTFRHTFGTLFMLNSSEGDSNKVGNAASECQTILGHSTAKMTRHYTRAALDKLALNAHSKYSPSGHMKIEL
jgi:integrase/recombinase XerC